MTLCRLSSFELWAVAWEICFLKSLQVKPTFIIPSSYLTLPGSILLPEVLPEVPPEVLLDVHLEVHLEALTSFNHTWVIPTHPRSIWVVWTLKSQEKSYWWVGGGWVGGWWKPILLYGSGPNPWVLSSLGFLTLTWPGPGPELDNDTDTQTQGCCQRKRLHANSFSLLIQAKGGTCKIMKLDGWELIASPWSCFPWVTFSIHEFGRNSTWPLTRRQTHVRTCRAASSQPKTKERKWW